MTQKSINRFLHQVVVYRVGVLYLNNTMVVSLKKSDRTTMLFGLQNILIKGCVQLCSVGFEISKN